MTSQQRNFTCNLCDALCGLHLTVDDNRITGVRGNPDDVLSRGHICPKGHALRELHEDPDRLRSPMRRSAPDRWEPIHWDDALDEAASRIKAIQRAHGRDAVAFYVGNPTAHSHHAAFGSQALGLALGTRNRFDPNSQDSNPRLFACMQLYGDGLSIPVPDVDRTDHLLILGANPAATNGSMMALGDVRGRLRGIRERGGRIVLVDPRRTETAAWCDQHHRIRPGGDAALLFACLHVLFAERRIDEIEVERIATGLSTVRALAARFSPERVAAAVGLDAGTIARIAREFATAPRAVLYARLGVCQNQFGPLASWLVEVTNAVTGRLDREGGAMFPSPAVDIGGLARWLVGNNYARWRSRVRGLPEFLGALPSAVMAEEMETPGEGQIRALICLAGNPVLSTPNGVRLGRAIAGLEYFVAVDLYLNETSRLAHLVLPPMTALESGNFELLLLGLSVRNVVKYSPPILEPPSGARDDWQILADLAARIALPASLAKSRLVARAIRGLPDRIIDGLLRIGPSRRTLESLAREPNGVDMGPLMPSLARRVHTSDGLIRLAPAPFVEDVPRLEAWVDAARGSGAIGVSGAMTGGTGQSTAAPTQLVLIGRRHLRSNNSWMHNLPSLVKGPNRATLLMHPDDAGRLALLDGSRVRIASRTGSVVATLAITADVLPGVVSLPHGYGHASAASTLAVAGALEGPNVNALSDELFVEPILGNSILTGIPVTVEAETVAAD